MRHAVSHERKLTLHDEKRQNAAADAEQRRREDGAEHEGLGEKIGETHEV